MKKMNMMVMALIVSTMIAMPASAKMAKSTKGFIIGALTGSAVTYMINRSGSRNQEVNRSQGNNCHIEEVLRKNEYGEYEKVNMEICK